MSGISYSLMRREALDRIYSFFGYLSFIHIFLNQYIRWNSNEFDLELNEVDLDILGVITLNENYTFCEDVNSYFFLIKNFNNNNVSKCLDFNNTKFDISFFDLINESILDDLNEFLKLYYLASWEKSIENSYIKFWALNEKIIKKICGRINDEKMLQYLEKVLKLYHEDNDFFIERIKSIRKKRNRFIHENINEITQMDRNLIKLISDLLICFIIQFSSEINNIRDYQIILDYFNRNNIEKTIELIKFSNNLFT